MYTLTTTLLAEELFLALIEGWSLFSYLLVLLLLLLLLTLLLTTLLAKFVNEITSWFSSAVMLGMESTFLKTIVCFKKR